MKRLFGLTGMVGSGKSTVAQIFEELGALLIDADLLAREATSPESEGLEKIRKHFGNFCINSDGTLNRQGLAKRIFADKGEREGLEAILHPIIRQLFLERLTEIRENEADGVVVYVIPLLFEKKENYPEIGKSILVAAPTQVCLERIMNRDHLSREEATLRYDAQMPLEEKRALADIVIENDSTLAVLRERAEAVWQKIRE